MNKIEDFLVTLFSVWLVGMGALFLMWLTKLLWLAVF